VGTHPPSLTGGHRVRYAVVGVVLVGALVFLVVKGLGSALNFYLPADQAVARQASLGTQTFNLEGVVEPGSVHSTPAGVDFVVTAGATRVQVDNSGSPPQLFQPNIPVIAVGHFSGTTSGGATFVSDQIMVKHSANYIAAHPGRVTAPNGTKR
jgi:cytochrome c-type biogenesis protein CcmE